MDNTGIFGDGPDMLIHSLKKDPQILKLAMIYQNILQFIKPLIYLKQNPQLTQCKVFRIKYSQKVNIILSSNSIIQFYLERSNYQFICQIIPYLFLNDILLHIFKDFSTIGQQHNKILPLILDMFFNEVTLQLENKSLLNSFNQIKQFQFQLSLLYNDILMYFSIKKYQNYRIYGIVKKFILKLNQISAQHEKFYNLIILEAINKNLDLFNYHNAFKSKFCSLLDVLDNKIFCQTFNNFYINKFMKKDLNFLIIIIIFLQLINTFQFELDINEPNCEIHSDTELTSLSFGLKPYKKSRMLCSQCMVDAFNNQEKLSSLVDLKDFVNNPGETLLKVKKASGNEIADLMEIEKSLVKFEEVFKNQLAMIRQNIQQMKTQIGSMTTKLENNLKLKDIDGQLLRNK
ncbi:hypothetical protein pb186bvf_003077 [Paramecium bursaria]